MASEATKIPFVEGAAPGTPAANRSIIYVKADGLFYSKDDAGAETLMSSGSAGSVATDAIWDAKGDLAVGTGANTAAKLTVGANDTIPMADSGETTGIKWVASATPTTQDYDDVAAAGTADTYARGDHLHGMPSASGGGGGLIGVTAYATAGDNSYAVTATSDADVDSTNLIVAFTAPASGNVLCKISALMTDGGNNVHWTIRESTTTKGDSYVSSAATHATRMTAEIYVSGISAGSHTYKFGCYTSAGTTTIYHGTTSAKFGYIIIEIWAAP